MDVRQIRLPRIPKREVQFLTPDEIQQYVAAIPLRNGPRLYDVDWLGFRVLVEVLLGTGARISEALSLKRSSINFQTGEATIIGKGNKERVLFFSPRALNWVKEYVTRRRDQGEALFVVGRRGKPLRLNAALTRFRRFRNMIHFPKPVTAHMLRHTVATTLLFNGCPIGHIKDILGHRSAAAKHSHTCWTTHQSTTWKHGSPNAAASETDSLGIARTNWNSKEDAERYHQEQFPKIHFTLGCFSDAP